MFLIHSHQQVAVGRDSRITPCDQGKDRLEWDSSDRIHNERTASRMAQVGPSR